MIVCHCRGISDRDVIAAVDEGAMNADDVAEMCGAGAHCGGCCGAVEEIVDARLGASSPPPVAVGAAPIRLPLLSRR